MAINLKVTQNITSFSYFPKGLHWIIMLVTHGWIGGVLIMTMNYKISIWPS